MRGSIKKRIGKRGGVSWYAVVDLPVDPATGKRRQKRLSANTKSKVALLVAELIHDPASALPKPVVEQTVAGHMFQWLEASRASVKPLTYRRYSDFNRIHIEPYIGKIKLTNLTRGDIQALYSDRLASGLSPTSVQHLHGVLHRALRQAVLWEVIDKNVADLVKVPRRSTPESKTWDDRQVVAFLEATAEDELETFWRLALLTGMRRGEMLGLRWEDLNIEAATLAVKRTLIRGQGGTWEEGTPKTAKGRRSIALSPSLLASFIRHRDRQAQRRSAAGSAWSDETWIFTNAVGNPIHANTIAARFTGLTTLARLPKIRLHDLRHTSATMSLSSGEHPKVVQERLGHADIAMTMNLYSHVSIGMQRDSADRLDRHLEKLAAESIRDTFVTKLAESDLTARLSGTNVENSAG